MQTHLTHFLKRQSLSDLKNENLPEIYKKISKRKQIRKIKISKLDKAGQEIQTERNKSFSVKSGIPHTKLKIT